MKRVALIDADILVWKACAVSQENVNFGTDEEPDWLHDPNERQAEMILRRYIASIKSKTESREVVLCLSPAPPGDRQHVTYWRHDVLPEYKQDRKSKEEKYMPPLLLFGHVREFLANNFNCITEPRLEADDIIGILATEDQFAEERVMVSIDKDFKQVPGQLFNPDHPEYGIRFTDEWEADRQHFMQMLVGDTTDNYKGCPGVGMKRATTLLDTVEEEWDGFVNDEEANPSELGVHQWKAVVNAFKKKDLTEEDALVQARVSRILRADEYDFKTRQVKLWEPPTR